ncbi:MAG: UDP-N-acetylmuramate dehydrogenase [Nitrospirota bacterium]|nr:UDP-N-acetylmuramate dehydrogenase [Nitrospirota bacterium]
MKEIFEKGLFKGEIKFDEPLSAHTSLRIGGPVDIMVFPEDPVSLKNVLAAAHRESIPVHVIGGGTNLLAGDGRVGGIAVSLRAFSNIENTRETTEEHVVLYAGAGVPLAALVNFSRRNGYSGIEALSGIPGYLGGAVYMNAGSFGTEIKDVIVSVAVMNMQGDISIMDRDRIAFSYRSSNLPEGLLILSANIRLKKDRPEDVDRRANEFLERKRASQPGGLSAGCVFKNPGADSAGRLIDAAGCKGMRVGAVEVSAVHANYFINKGGATARDFIELMDAVRERVRDNSGIELEPEIKFIDT